MFYNCSSLTSLNLSNFNTNNKIDTKEIFDGVNKKSDIITNDIKFKDLFNK